MTPPPPPPLLQRVEDVEKAAALSCKSRTQRTRKPTNSIVASPLISARDSSTIAVHDIAPPTTTSGSTNRALRSTLPPSHPFPAGASKAGRQAVLHVGPRLLSAASRGSRWRNAIPVTFVLLPRPSGTISAILLSLFHLVIRRLYLCFTFSAKHPRCLPRLRKRVPKATMWTSVYSRFESLNAARYECLA